MKNTSDPFWLRSALIASVAVLVAALSGCSLSPDTGFATLHFEFKATPESRALRFGDELAFSPAALTIPSALSEFNCFGVNITGTGIPPSKPPKPGDHENPDTLLTGLLSGKSCAYGGVTSPPISPSADATVALTVPTGPQRIIQVVGAVSEDGAICAGSAPLADPSRDNNGGGGNKENIYELGRSITDVFKSKSVAIPNSYSGLTTDAQRTARLVNCGDGNFRPTELGGLQVWMDAGSYVAGNTNWSSSGGAISSMTIGAAASVIAGPNGRPGLRMPSSSYFTASSAGISENGLTAVAVMAAANCASNTAEMLRIGSSEHLVISNAYSGSQTFAGEIKTSASPVTKAYPAVTGWAVHALNWDKSGTTMLYRATSANSASTTSANLGAAMNLSGGNIQFGNSVSACNIDVAELVVYDHNLSPNDFGRVIGYLAGKYGLN